MATNQQTNTDWRRSAGDFVCTSCGRKRLPAMAFSKAQVKIGLANVRATGVCSAKCLQCTHPELVAQEKEAARQALQAKQAASAPPDDGKTWECCACKEQIPSNLFSKSQLNHATRGRPAKCRACARKAAILNETPGGQVRNPPGSGKRKKKRPVNKWANMSQQEIRKSQGRDTAMRRTAPMRAPMGRRPTGRGPTGRGTNGRGTNRFARGGKSDVAQRLAALCMETAKEAEMVTGLAPKRGGRGSWRARRLRGY